MAADRQYTDSIQSRNAERKHWSEETSWEPLSAAVRRLKERVERAYYACDEDGASEAHDDLTSAEWRLRQAERRDV